MRKTCVSLLLCITIIISAASFTYAAESISENPGLKVIIDGNPIAFNDVPILADGRTLLPLRDILTGLGVQNDDQHIIWNAGEKSVTVLKDETTVILKVDDKNALVNDGVVPVDVAPVNYKNRVYIPARFVSLALGKKVGWDSATSTLLISDESRFNRVKEIIEKSIEAMNQVERYKSIQEANLVVNAAGNNYTFNTTINMEGDNKNKIINGSIDRTQVMTDGSVNKRVYVSIADNAGYAKFQPEGQWQKQDKNPEEFAKNFVFTELEANDTNCSALGISESDNPEEMLLEGKIGLSEFSKEYMDFEGFSDYAFKDAYIIVSINKTNNLVNYILLSVNGSTTQSIPGGAGFTLQLKKLFTDYNGVYEVKLPDGI